MREIDFFHEKSAEGLANRRRAIGACGAPVFLALTLAAGWIAFATSFGVGWRVLAGVVACGWGVMAWRAWIQVRLLVEFKSRGATE